MKTLCIGVLAAVALAGCAPKYRVNSAQAESPVLPTDCELRLLSEAPKEPYSIVGTVEPEKADELTADEREFLDAVRAAACRHAGNAIITVRDEGGRYVSGTVISLR